MSIFDDPNREAVGLAPIWTGAGEPDVVEPQKAPATKKGAASTPAPAPAEAPPSS